MTKTLLSAALGFATLMINCALAQSPPTHEHSFDHAEMWAKSFDDPARDAWQKPHEVIRALALAPDATVADIGSGTGYFAVRLAHAVPRGMVIGVDASRDMVRYLNERAKRDGLANLSSQMGGASDPRLAVPVDLVLMVDTYHHIGSREKYFTRVRQALKPGGRLAIIDFRLDAPTGPPRSSRISPEQVKRELARAGFELEREHDFLPQQFFLVLRAAK
jgi:cyclopropane fatty-acyl-phospholipid synthase-like methyltransferase